MSDDIVKALETMDWDDIHSRPSAAGLLMEEAAAEITRLRAEVATARQDALAEIKQDTDELIEQGRQDGMEYAAQIADRRAADWAKSAKGKYLETKWDYESRADAGEEIAADIRAAAKEEQ